MGKEGDLWDDSALINAFDDAVSKYKVMHGKKNRDTSTEGGEFVGGTGENASADVNQTHDFRRDADEKSNVASSTATDLGETSKFSPVKENHCVDSSAPAERCMDSSNVHLQDAQHVINGCSYSYGTEDYNQLLSQYYELEEKRQKILEQLHQYGGWNYQYSGEGSGSGVQWGSCSTSQEHPLCASQVSHPNVICSCCPYVCQCLVAPCPSLDGTCVGKTCTDTSSVAMVPGRPCLLEDGDIVKTAMGAAERAISSMRTKISGDSNINGEKEKEIKEGETTQSGNPETDLTVVLNAWYSAGFYTGKYLTEQSIAKKGHS